MLTPAKAPDSHGARHPERRIGSCMKSRSRPRRANTHQRVSRLSR